MRFAQYLPCAGAQILARATLQENTTGLFCQLAYAGGKPNRISQLPGPVLRVLRIACLNQLAGQTRIEIFLRNLQRETPHNLREGRHHRLHHRGMKGMRGMKRDRANTFFVELRL